ncbi:hypothetical protein L211DRAFT_835228 [Terfezia boudieri ATCC MYA-4762]|uniref:Uncharacterized protein n=1 Tax=Terfezia boudieri ATCC MYA-4762 TaxID=1051890 RepID=A0A3N4M1S1_9PEZI|nr:hypothetical protein L211DRAFT_835228 [Terfezia boudieri ATCC MYA-4762]
MEDNVEFRYALGDFGQTDPGQLFYHASTEKRQSGGPVWVLVRNLQVSRCWCAHLGKQGISTTFDIIPAHTPPTDAGVPLDLYFTG